jgi:hypothetical protein
MNALSLLVWVVCAISADAVAMDKDLAPGGSVNPYARTRNQTTASTVNNARICDTTRTEREGGGSAMKTAEPKQ